MTTLKEYIVDLQKFADKHPELLNKSVGYITDDEFIGFSNNVCSPTIIYYHEDAQETLTQSDVDIYTKEGDLESLEGFKQYVVIN